MRHGAVGRRSQILARQDRPAGLGDRFCTGMPDLVQREQVVTLVDEAVRSGARRRRACEVIGLSIRTLQRWRPVG